MFDCGIHPAYAGLAGLPYFDEIDDPSSIDLLLVSHFHLDHAAALPYFLEKTTFKGRVFMTHPTKAIYKLLLTDYVKVSNISIEEILYNEQELKNSMDKIETVNYHQEVEYNGIKFACYNAGHVLGAAMFMVQIASVRLLYTGDFSRQEDRHLMAAETPIIKPDILIVESTYGVQIHEPRKEREARFTGKVHEIVRRGGRCLIPVFALGRAQELLLILDEYWEAHPELHGIKIYYASALAKKCMAVYQTYINMMNEKIQNQFAIENPFVFKHIFNIKGKEDIDQNKACVVMASPGMLQSGLSRDLFELWCSEKKNGVILPGYSVEGTLAKHILSEPTDITTSAGVTVPLHLSVYYISFSAHSDFKQTSEFIDILKPPYVVLVHGDQNEMNRLKQALILRYQDNVKILSPKNCQPVHIKFRAEKVAKVVGSLASAPPEEGLKMSGLLVEKDFNYQLLSPKDLHTYTQLSTATVWQKLILACRQPFEAIKISLENVYEMVSWTSRDDKTALVVEESVYIVFSGAPDTLALEWMSNPLNDMIADSIVAIIMQLEVRPPSTPISKKKYEVDLIIQDFMAHQFGETNVMIDRSSNTIIITNNSNSATINLAAKNVQSDNTVLKERVQQILEKVLDSIGPVPTSKIRMIAKEEA